MTEAANTHQDPAAIERDIKRTQEEMGRTVNQIGDQLTPRNMLNALLDQVEGNNIDARKLLDGARRNPLALAMIAGGAIWLASDSDAKLPKMRTKEPGGSKGQDRHHQDYVAHMDNVGRRDNEDDASYQQRRDMARSNYFMVERGHGEEDHAFRERLDSAAEKFRERRHAWSDQARHAGDAVAHSGKAAIDQVKETYHSSPLVGGLAAGAVGALLGSLFPVTRPEEAALSGLGQKARELAAEEKDKLVDAARDQKDELVASAEQLARIPEEDAAAVT